NNHNMRYSLFLMDASKQIDQMIAGLGDWRGKILSQLRKIIHEADPDIKEEWKWDTAVFTHGKMVCATSAFKNHVKINFFNGAKLSNPHKIINNGFTSKQHRSIDFFEGDKIPVDHLRNLIKESISLNSKK